MPIIISWSPDIDPNTPLSQNPLREDKTSLERRQEKATMRRYERDAEMWKDPNYREICKMRFQGE